ncbi:MAG: addiction module protein [Lysobacterales bacterium CG_4_10_14_3_um_filter_64_11]|nr:MAG: addiction module protein [Xanthomonadales bacterium CG_4_10_14_3_um_filter_64_11]
MSTTVYILPAFTILTTATFDRWRATLRDRQARMRITARLKRVEHGNVGHAKSVGGGVSELRVDYGPGYRLYFTRRGFAVIVLLGGGNKSTEAQGIKAAQAIAAQVE